MKNIITVEQLNKIMIRFVEYATISLPEIGRHLTQNKYIGKPALVNAMQIERAFILSAAYQILDQDRITYDQLPPIVQTCWLSGRSLLTVGKWHPDADGERLRQGQAAMLKGS